MWRSACVRWKLLVAVPEVADWNSKETRTDRYATLHPGPVLLAAFAKGKPRWIPSAANCDVFTLFGAQALDFESVRNTDTHGV